MKIIKKPAKVWYLEMTDPSVKSDFSNKLEIVRQYPVDSEQYLNIYKEVGGPWDWANRLLISKEELHKVLEDEQNRIYYCYYKSEFAGYFELQVQQYSIELVYFGLSPKYIGKGLGIQMMKNVIKKAELQNAKRLWLHTCEFDSPQALSFYLKSGFSIYDEKIEDQTIIKLPQ